MLTFVDGPAAGRKLGCRRAPHFLRVVVHRRTGRIDVLDQLTDEPMPLEDVHVYEATGPTSDGEGMARRGIIVCPPPGGTGEYRYRPDVDGQRVRSTPDWRAWARAQVTDIPLVDPTR